jgi:3-hydroxyisobutyrate dehydrogenase/2-hydroxy-3-oxopropionate reductase
MPRALEGDCAPQAATALLKKDVGIAVETAAALGCVAPLARAAREVFDAAVAAGGGADDEPFSLKYYAGCAKQTQSGPLGTISSDRGRRIARLASVSDAACSF